MLFQSSVLMMEQARLGKFHESLQELTRQSRVYFMKKDYDNMKVLAQEDEDQER